MAAKLGGGGGMGGGGGGMGGGRGGGGGGRMMGLGFLQDTCILWYHFVFVDLTPMV
jgi:hypothetical protein